MKSLPPIKHINREQARGLDHSIVNDFKIPGALQMEVLRL